MRVIIVNTDESIDPKDILSRRAVIEHLKKRLYESALNNEGIVSETFEEIADNRIDIWLNELEGMNDISKT